MNLSELKSAEGSRQNNWRKGRGHGSGNGKTAGRGHKGQGARSGSGGKAGFYCCGVSSNLKLALFFYALVLLRLLISLM